MKLQSLATSAPAPEFELGVQCPRGRLLQLDTLGVMWRAVRTALPGLAWFCGLSGLPFLPDCNFWGSLATWVL